MPLKILLVASSYAPNVGGLQTVASAPAGELLRRGYGVQVITPRVPRTLPARAHIDGVLVRRWSFLAPRAAYLRHGRADLWLAGLAALPVTLARLLRHLARERPDVVNLQFAGSPALLVLLAHRLRPFRLVVSLHGDDVEGLPYRSALDRAVFRALLSRAALVTACSRYLAEQAALLAPELAGRIRVIYNGHSPDTHPLEDIAGHEPQIYNGLRPAALPPEDITRHEPRSYAGPTPKAHPPEDIAGHKPQIYNGLRPADLPPRAVAFPVPPRHTGINPEMTSIPASRDGDPLAPGRPASHPATGLPAPAEQRDEPLARDHPTSPTATDLRPPVGQTNEPFMSRRPVSYPATGFHAPFDTGPTLFAAGRLVHKKGFDLLLRALSICANPPLQLTLCGDGPERHSLHALAHELHLDDRLIFAGALPHQELLSVMARSSLVVVPSRQEPFGLVALEAMLAAKPVVASAAGGLPEVLAGADALLVPPADVAALARAIDQALARLAAQPDYGARNRQLASRFSLDRMLDAYARAYAAVMAA